MQMSSLFSNFVENNNYPLEYLFLFGHSERCAEESARVGRLDLCNLLGCSRCNYPAAAFAALGTEIDDIIGALDNLGVVLNDKNCVARIDES